MSKFVIQCPNCNKYAEANSGLFGFIGRTRKVNCSCGYTIDVHTEKLTSRVCHHCGNNVVFDQSKGNKAKCPVCGEAINTLAEQGKLVEISCAQCGVRLQTNKGTQTYKCPVCDYENDVAERLKTEQIRTDGLASIIKYEGDNETLVWKHPIEDFNLGSQLIVHESQEAIFFRDGQALDLFGAGRYTLETQQLPILEQFYKLPTDTEGTFHSEVYYINMTTQMGIKWGTDTKVRLFDPASGLHVELGASGEFNVRVINSRKLLLKLVGTTKTLNQEQLLGTNGKGYFRAMVMTHVKSYLATVIRENSISVLEIDERLIELSDALREKINEKLFEYGLEMTEFFVSRVVTPDEDSNFRRMKQQFAEQYLNVRQEQIRQKEAEAAAKRKTVEMQTEAQLKIIGAQGEAEALRIQKAAQADAYRMQAEAEATEMRMKGYTYQQETARQVGLEAMQNGIVGNGSSMTNGLGDLASLGVTLGAMGGVINMTKEAITPVLNSSSQIGQNVINTVTNTWDCSCGTKGIETNFCPNCGARKPVPKQSWNCICGQENIVSNFCPNCGTKRQENKTWDCKCGIKDIETNFCPNCGAKKPMKNWNCECGQMDITTNFCPNCGKKRGE